MSKQIVPMNFSLSKIHTDVDFGRDGRQIGDLRLRPSDNTRSLGYHPVPVACFKNGAGPTLLVTGGTHGDEFEGPAALMHLMHTLDATQLKGRLIMIPALNGPALRASTRCSPIDDVNLNRCFPGNANGTASEKIAHLIEAVILPHCDAAIDIHSGGRASEFVPLTMYMPCAGDLGTDNHRIAAAFGAPWCWIMGDSNDSGSVNGAAARQNVPMFATELGGGGNVNPEHVQLAVDGILRTMQTLGMYDGAPDTDTTSIQYFTVPATSYTLFAARDGLFAPATGIGQSVTRGDTVGVIYSIFEPERKPLVVSATVDGIIVSCTHNGQVERGDFLLQLGHPA